MKTLKFLATAAAVVLVSLTATARGVLGIDGEEATSVGIYIKNLTTGKVVMQHNAGLALTPASVMKAVTTASVLSKYGSDSCFTTSVRLTGSSDENGWHGDIVVDACADPTIESSNFKSRQGFCDSIANALVRLGVKDIDGDIVVRQNLRDAGPILQWECEDIAWPYGAGLHGMNWRDNTTTLTPATGTTSPHVPGLEVCTVVSDSNDLVRGMMSDRLMVYTKGQPKADTKLDTTVPDPATVFREELRKRLDAKGISMTGEEARAEGNTLLYTHRSAPFGEIMKSLMVRSDNLFAEGMLRTLAPGASRKSHHRRKKCGTHVESAHDTQSSTTAAASPAPTVSRPSSSPTCLSG